VSQQHAAGANKKPQSGSAMPVTVMQFISSRTYTVFRVVVSPLSRLVGDLLYWSELHSAVAIILYAEPACYQPVNMSRVIWRSSGRKWNVDP